MNRPLKFRVWDIVKKQFIPIGVYGIITTEFNSFGVMTNDWEEYREGEFFYSNSQIVSQFTGLHDKNGKEIYEGDILNVEDRIVKVVWHNESASFDTNFVKSVYDSWGKGINNQEWKYRAIVIGNIFENPELIKS